MKDKSTTSAASPQHLIANLLKNEKNIEFLGIHETKAVLWMHKDHTYEFEKLPIGIFKILANAYTCDEGAKRILKVFAENGKLISFRRQVELYTYFMYGGLDDTADIIDGVLQPCENFRHSADCISLGFDKKVIRLNGNALKPRELMMIDLMADDLDPKDEVIAQKMGLAHSTYNQHKRSLFEKSGVHSKHALMWRAARERVARVFNMA